MIAYLLRRLLLAVPTLIGVNLLLFTLFFVISSPDDMARAQLGAKRVTPEAIERWKADRGYDKPLFWNAQAEGGARFTETIFVQKSARMFLFDFGKSDVGRDINRELRTRMWPSLALALPVFLVGLFVAITLALLLAKVVLFPDGWRAAPDWSAVLIALAAWFLLERARWPLGPVLLAAAASGLFLRMLQQ